MVLSIDEFKGNAGGQKYQCILVDPIKHSVLDILPSRSQTQLVSYFRSIPKKEILQEATGLVKKGYQELILVAQDTARYGEDIFGKKKFILSSKKYFERRNISLENIFLNGVLNNTIF